MNQYIWIKLSSVYDVKNFVNITQAYHGIEIDVHVGRYCLDGKSIMGMLSMDLSHEIGVEMLTDDEATKASFYRQIKQFEVVKSND